jgi:hypothetical protein
LARIEAFKENAERDYKTNNPVKIKNKGLLWGIIGTAILPLVGTAAGYFIGKNYTSEDVKVQKANVELAGAEAAYMESRDLEGEQNIDRKAYYTSKLSRAQSKQEFLGDGEYSKEIGLTGGLAAAIFTAIVISALGSPAAGVAFGVLVLAAGGYYGVKKSQNYKYDANSIALENGEISYALEKAQLNPEPNVSITISSGIATEDKTNFADKAKQVNKQPKIAT